MPATKKRTTSAAPVAKRSRVDPQIAQRDSVAKALKVATDKNVAKMFTEMLPFVFVEPRHQYQDGVLDMISGILIEHETNLRSQVSEHETFVAGGDDERTKREQAIAEAETAAAAKIEALKSAGEILEVAKSELDSAKESLSTAESEKDATAARNSAAAANKETLELALELKQKLDAGIEDDAERQNQCNQLHKLLSPVVEDKNMLNAMKFSLAKPKDALEAFDSMVVQCVDTEMKKAQETVQKTLAEVDSSQAAADAKVEDCKTVVEKRSQALTDAKLGVSTAKSAKQECDAALKTAKSNLSALKGELKESKSNLDDANKTLSDFVDGALSTFKTLRDPPKESAEEEAVAAEEPTAQEDQMSVDPPKESPKEVEQPPEVEPTPA